MRKKAVGTVLALGLFVLMSGEWSAYGAEKIRESQNLIMEAPEEGTAEETMGADRLYLDNQNRYPGMEKAYQDGYEPLTQENRATLILPLTTVEESRISSVTVTPDLGDQTQSPFVFRNYQKTFQKTLEPINETEEQKEVFLIRFDLELSENRKNGSYPVRLKAEYSLGRGEEGLQEFTVYVQITDGTSALVPTGTPGQDPGAEGDGKPGGELPPEGSNPNGTDPDGSNPDSSNPDGSNPDGSNPDDSDPNGSNPDGLDPDGLDPDSSDVGGYMGGSVSVGGSAQEEAPSSDPKVILIGCTGAPEHIYAGETAAVTVLLKNTNKKKFVQNMTVSVACEAGIRLQSSSDTFYFDRLGAEETLELPLEFQIDEKAEAGEYTAELTMSYDNPDAVSLTSSGRIHLKVEQACKVEMEVGEIAEEINAGDYLQIPIQVMNLGRGPVYNVRCSIDVPGLRADKSLFLGNIDGGTAASGDLGVFAGIVNESAETAEGRYGRTSGQMILTYEGENGVEQQEYQDLVITVLPLQIREAKSEPEEEFPIEKQLAVGAGVLVLICAAGVGGSVWLKKRKRGERYE